jgi:hypothetical protein
LIDDNIPDVSPLAVDAITEMLIEDQGILRPPVKAAHLLALICKLHEQNRPFPRREDVAEAIGAGVSTIDAALSTRLDEKYIELRIETRPGNVERRHSVIRERYYEPSQKLLNVYRNADRKNKDAKRAMQKRSACR